MDIPTNLIAYLPIQISGFYNMNQLQLCQFRIDVLYPQLVYCALTEQAVLCFYVNLVIWKLQPITIKTSPYVCDLFY